MSNDRTLGSLFGKAKEWARQELKNTTRIGDGSQSGRRAEEANDRLEREIHDDGERMAQDAALEALLPQSVKDYRDHVEADRVRRHDEGEAEARARRQARAGDSAVTLTGAVTGTAGGLAVEVVTGDADDHELVVNVEAVDPVQMVGGTMTGFCFLIPGFHGDGTYPLLDPELDSLQYQLYLVEDDEGWGFHPTHGPGVIVVSDGVADVRLVLGGVGTETIDLTARVVLSLG